MCGLRNGSGVGRKAATGIASHHQYGGANDPNLPPIGAILRLKSSFDTSRLLRGGERHPGNSEVSRLCDYRRWDIRIVLPGSGRHMGDRHGKFVAAVARSPSTPRTSILWRWIAARSIQTSGRIPPFTAAPTISSFTASPSGTVAAGTAVTLSWGVSGATAIRYLYPEVGPVRGPACPAWPLAGMTRRV